MAKDQYAVLVISEWHNPATRESGTKFVKVGVAYERSDVPGFTCYLDAGIAVSGKLLIALDFDEPPPKKAKPKANQPSSPGPNDDEPF